MLLSRHKCLMFRYFTFDRNARPPLIMGWGCLHIEIGQTTPDIWPEPSMFSIREFTTKCLEYPNLWFRVFDYILWHITMATWPMWRKCVDWHGINNPVADMTWRCTAVTVPHTQIHFHILSAVQSPTNLSIKQNAQMSNCGGDLCKSHLQYCAMLPCWLSKLNKIELTNRLVTLTAVIDPYLNQCPSQCINTLEFLCRYCWFISTPS